MKKLFILFGGICLFCLNSCSNDNPENTTTEQILKKVITYEPSFANYTKKRIQYYSNNAIVADTTFNVAGVWTQRVVTILNGNIKTTQTYNSQNTITNTSTEEYDTNGRLINTSGAYNTNFTYNSDNTITASSSVNGDPYFIFSKNPDGLINNRLEINDNSNVSLNFQNQLPIAYLNDGFITGYFTYYPNIMPNNLLKSITQMNNTILRAYRLEHLPSVCNAYLNNWLGLYHYEREFNSENYQIHSKRILIETTETVTSESFYFYN